MQQAVPYLKLSLVVAGATALATRSLVYVSYPTKVRRSHIQSERISPSSLDAGLACNDYSQVVFKSAKLIPTMAVDSCLDHGGSGGSKYGWIDYLAAILLCAGAAGFSFAGSSQSSSGAVGGGGSSSELYGVALLGASVVCDAFLPNLQKRLMSRSEASSSGSPADLSNATANRVSIAGREEQGEHASCALQLPLNSSVIPLLTQRPISGDCLGSEVVLGSASTQSSSNAKGADIDEGLSAAEVMVNTNGKTSTEGCRSKFIPYVCVLPDPLPYKSS